MAKSPRKGTPSSISSLQAMYKRIYPEPTPENLLVQYAKLDQMGIFSGDAFLTPGRTPPNPSPQTPLTTQTYEDASMTKCVIHKVEKGSQLGPAGLWQFGIFYSLADAERARDRGDYENHDKNITPDMREPPDVDAWYWGDFCKGYKKPLTDTLWVVLPPNVFHELVMPEVNEWGEVSP